MRQVEKLSCFERDTVCSSWLRTELEEVDPVSARAYVQIAWPKPSPKSVARKALVFQNFVSRVLRQYSQNTARDLHTDSGARRNAPDLYGLRWPKSISCQHGCRHIVSSVFAKYPSRASDETWVTTYSIQAVMISAAMTAIFRTV